MSYWQTKQFRELQLAWYAKLESEGFDDAEELIGGELRLKQSATHPIRHVRSLFDFSTKEAYFSELGSLVQGHIFHNNVDRIILTMFADGEKISRIVQALEELGSRRCRMTVRMTIRKYEMAWGMRQYTPKQLNKKLPRTA